VYLTQADHNAKHLSSETRKSQDDNVVQTLNVTIAAINATKELVPVNLAKGILGTIANILSTVQVRSIHILANCRGWIIGCVQSAIKNKSDFLAIINMCDVIRGVLEEATEGTTEDDLRGSFGNALSKLSLLAEPISPALKTDDSVTDQSTA
jgi:hypothetical protein